MIYTLDTSFFIDAKNWHMPIETGPSFWCWLIYLAEKKIISIHKQVYIEITAGNDSLAKWMKDNKDVLVDKNIAIEQISKVMTEVYGILDEVELEKIKEDQWAIAYAFSTNRIVVTSERPGKQTAPLNKKFLLYVHHYILKLYDYIFSLADAFFYAIKCISLTGRDRMNDDRNILQPFRRSQPTASATALVPPS